MSISLADFSSIYQGFGGSGSGGDPLAQLTKAIQSGNLSSAQSAYASVSSLLSDLTSSASRSSASATSSTTSNAGSTTDETNPFQQLLASIGKDLSGGDITSAQDTLSEFAQNAPSGLTYDQFT